MGELWGGRGGPVVVRPRWLGEDGVGGAAIVGGGSIEHEEPRENGER